MLGTLQCPLFALRCSPHTWLGGQTLPNVLSGPLPPLLSLPTPRFPASAQQSHCHLLTDQGLSLLLFFLPGGGGGGSPSPHHLVAVLVFRDGLASMLLIRRSLTTPSPHAPQSTVDPSNFSSRLWGCCSTGT